MKSIVILFHEELPYLWCTTKVLAGIEKGTRRQLAEVLRKSKGTVTVEEASAILRLWRRLQAN